MANQDNALEPLHLNVKESAKFLGMSRNTFYRRREKLPDFPEVHVDGGLRLVRIDDLRRWADSLKKVRS